MGSSAAGDDGEQRSSERGQGNGDGNGFGDHGTPMIDPGSGCLRYAAYMYSVENSAVSEAMSGMMFLSMNAG